MFLAKSTRFDLRTVHEELLESRTLYIRQDSVVIPLQEITVVTRNRLGIRPDSAQAYIIRLSVP